VKQKSKIIEISQQHTCMGICLDLAVLSVYLIFNIWAVVIGSNACVKCMQWKNNCS